MSPQKEQEKSHKKELKKMEATNIPGAVFKTMIIRVPKDLRGRVDYLNKNLKS